jgi:hypothetical protein
VYTKSLPKEKMMADNDKQGEKQNLPGGPDFMARLRENINERTPEPRPTLNRVEPLPMPDPPEEVQKYAPPSVRREHKNKTRNQTIAEFIIALPYREAMMMGTGIASKLGTVDAENGGRVDIEKLTRAIQDWAWEWETFQDEERPVPRSGQDRRSN